MASNKTTQLKKRLIEASRANFGNVTKTCEVVGISRKMFYNFLNNDKDFKTEIEHIDEANLDFAESKLRELIDGVHLEGEADGEVTVYKAQPNVTATIFYLKTKGKKRGYVEKQEVEHSGVIKTNLLIPTQDDESN